MTGQAVTKGVRGDIHPRRGGMVGWRGRMDGGIKGRRMQTDAELLRPRRSKEQRFYCHPNHGASCRTAGRPSS
ncbi:hypothetical protein EYF80_041447 [Liparis tanakae]|uniref:Uncharacterized protein n=1 Tax=Liparis tanakae TaxID=230148 RepID=A0A4Z2G4A8_9TELE|nr:hypothetical protein EYF80_041447 [Liparis tanakae]